MAASSYSKTQVWLHWAVAAMILVQFVFPDGMQHAWRAFRRSQEVASGDMPLAYMHIVLGIAVLVLAAWRLGLRFKLGAPPPPPGEHPALRLPAAAVQTIIYALIAAVIRLRTSVRSAAYAAPRRCMCWVRTCCFTWCCCMRRAHSSSISC